MTTRDSNTVKPSASTVVITATIAGSTPNRHDPTTTPKNAITVATGGTPAMDAPSSPKASFVGDSGSRAKFSGRRVSSPPPMRIGPASQPTVHTSIVAAAIVVPMDAL